MARPANTDIENERMRERLSDGALELFRSGGVSAVSLRKLSREVGVSHTLLYRHFTNKEDLLTAIRLRSMTALEKSLKEVDDSNADVLTRIRAAALALVEFGRKHRREYRFIFADEQPQLDQKHALLELRHRVFDHIVALAEEAKSHGLLAQDPRTWVHIAWGLIHGMLVLEESDQLVEGRELDDLLGPALEMLLPQAS